MIINIEHIFYFVKKMKPKKNRRLSLRGGGGLEAIPG